MKNSTLRTSAQDSSSRHSSRIYFPRQKYAHKHHIFIHYSMHIRIMDIQSHLFWEHHAFYTSWHCIQLTFFLFRKKGQSKDDYYQLSQFQIRYLYLARAYLWATISRLDSCIQPGHVWRVWRFDSCNQPGHIYWRLIPDSIPVSSQGMSVDNISRLDSCI